MSDDVKALIAEARERFHYASGFVAMRELAIRLADALEAATVAPAVDREALAKAYNQGWDDPEYNNPYIAQAIREARND